MSTPTLQDLRKAKFKTIKLFSLAYGCSTSKASGILHGNYHKTLTKDEVIKLAALFEVPFETCIAACDASYAEWYCGTPQHNDLLKNRWAWEEEIRQSAEQAAKTNDWSFFRFSRFSFNYQDETGKYWNTTGSSQNYDSGSTGWHTTITPISSCYALLGVSQNATEAQIKQAFREKVRLAHKGNGDYAGDMDKLTRAKEQALRFCSQ